MKTPHLLLILLCFFFSYSMTAQPIFSNIHRDTTLANNLGGNLIFKSRDGNYITIGDRVQYYLPIHGTTSSIYVNKTSPSGQLIYERSHYIPDMGHHMNAYEDSTTGEIVVVGSGFDGNLQYPHSDPAIVRLDSVGNLLTSGYVSFDYPMHYYMNVNAIKSGNNRYTFLALATEIVINGPFGIPTYIETNAVITLDQNRNVLQYNDFPRTVGGGGNTIGGLVQTPDNGFLFGELKNWQTYINKVSNFLVLEWSVLLTTVPGMRPIEIYQVSDSNYILLCSKQHSPGTPYARTDLHKFSPSGTLIWSKIYQNIEATELLERSDGSFYLACGFVDTATNDVNMGVCVLDAQGNLINSKQHPYPNRDLIGGIIENDCNGYVLTGMIDYINYMDTMIGPGKCIIISDTISMLSNPCAVLHTNDIHEENGTIYPNPFSDYLTIEVPMRQKRYTFNLFNNSGQLIHSEILFNPINEVKISKDLPSGFYYYNINTENGLFQVGKLIKS